MSADARQVIAPTPTGQRRLGTVVAEAWDRAYGRDRDLVTVDVDGHRLTVEAGEVEEL